MKAHLSQTIRNASLLAGAMLALGSVRTFGAAVPEDAFPNFDSYIKVSGLAASISGNEAAFQNRKQLPDNGGIGIEDLHLSKDAGKDTTMDIDGHAMTGLEDYLGQVKFTKTDVGTFEAGYKSFRTFYDGVGGFFPVNKQFMALPNEELNLDRGKLWVTATIACPDAPVFTISYVNETRNGQKDSTIWGDSDFTGLPFNVAPNPITPARKFAPSYLDVDERHQVLQGSVRHTIKNTTLSVTALADKVNNLDSRYVTRFPGEVIPWAIASLPSASQPAAKALVGPQNWNNQVAIAETEGVKASTSEFIANADTVLNDKVTFHVGADYELVHTDISGDRPLVTSTPTSTGVVLVTTNNYQGLNGGTKVQNFVGKLELDYKPTKDWFLKFAWRWQDEYLKGTSNYNVLAASGTPALTVTSTPRVSYARIDQQVSTPVFEFRYIGIKNLAIYFNGSLRDLSGVENNTSAYNPLTATSGTVGNNNISEDHGNYTLGANWRQSDLLTLRGEIYHKDHKDDAVGYGVNLGDNYLLDSQYTGVKLTALLQATPTLKFSTRYIYQQGKMKVTGFLPTYAAYDSLDSKNHMFSETVDWNPNPQCYLQINGTLVFNVINTVYPRAGITPPTSTLSAYDSNRILQNSDNNYVTLSVLSGFVVSKSTDLQVQYYYYKADNGDAALAALTMPYGVAVTDNAVTVGIKHKVSDRTMIYAKLGYVDSANDTTGGFTNFHGPIGYLSISHAL